MKPGSRANRLMAWRWTYPHRRRTTTAERHAISELVVRTADENAEQCVIAQMSPTSAFRGRITTDKAGARGHLIHPVGAGTVERGREDGPGVGRQCRTK